VGAAILKPILKVLFGPGVALYIFVGIVGMLVVVLLWNTFVKDPEEGQGIKLNS
jgi:hypothetical protein